jgi:hypothetical protein
MIFVLSLLNLPGQAVAAIPCEELPVIRAPRELTSSDNPPQLPLSVADVLSGDEAADRTGAETANNTEQSRLEMAAENQFRCLEYGNSADFLGNSTPYYRLDATGHPNVERDTDYIAATAVQVSRFDTALALDRGRFLIDFVAVINGESSVEGEIVFVELDGWLYLDGSHLNTDMATGTTHEVLITDRPLRQPYVVNVVNGDTVIFNSTSDDSSASIIITNTDGETVFEGFAGGTGLVGGSDENVFVALNMEPGNYTATISMFPGDAVSTITLRILD